MWSADRDLVEVRWLRGTTAHTTTAHTFTARRHHHPQQVCPEIPCVIVPLGDTELAATILIMRLVESVHEYARHALLHLLCLHLHHRLLHPLLFARYPKQLDECVRESREVNRRRLRLPPERIGHAAAYPRVVERDILLHEREGAVVESQAVERGKQQWR